MAGLTAIADEIINSIASNIFTDEQHLCISAINLKKRLEMGDKPPKPFEDVDCYACINNPGKQSGIYCKHYQSPIQIPLKEKIENRINGNNR